VKERRGDAVKERRGDAVKERCGDAVKERCGDAVKERCGDAVKERLGRGDCSWRSNRAAMPPRCEARLCLAVRSTKEFGLCPPFGLWPRAKPERAAQPQVL